MVYAVYKQAGIPVRTTFRYNFTNFGSSASQSQINKHLKQAPGQARTEASATVCVVMVVRGWVRVRPSRPRRSQKEDEVRAIYTRIILSYSDYFSVLYFYIELL
jgi:hypothetical protein